MKVEKAVRDFLIEVQRTKKITPEGNILKLIEAEPGDTEFAKYLSEAIEKDKDARRRRLDITKQVQEQNKSLLDSQSQKEKLMQELKDALSNAESAKDEAERMKEEAESAKDAALNDLDIIQKKSQTELISTIVKVALIVILSVGGITTIMYAVAMMTGKDTQIIGSTWSNMFGILLTNAFSIVGTIMGVKYASENKEK
jgi:hypothetical protein